MWNDVIEYVNLDGKYSDVDEKEEEQDQED